MINNADYRLKKRHQSYQSRLMLGTIQIPDTGSNRDVTTGPVDSSVEYLRSHSRKHHWSNMQSDTTY